MLISYNSKHDVLVVDLGVSSDRYHETKSVTAVLDVDVDSEGVPLRFVIYDAKRYYDATFLAEFNQEKVWLTLKEASAQTGLSAETLRVQVRNNRLRATKRGRVLMTTVDWLEEYLFSRKYNAKPVEWKHQAERAS